jgi:hypothetical protein
MCISSLQVSQDFKLLANFTIFPDPGFAACEFFYHLLFFFLNFFYAAVYTRAVLRVDAAADFFFSAERAPRRSGGQRPHYWGSIQCNLV